MTRQFRRATFKQPKYRQTQARLYAHPMLKIAHKHYQIDEYIEASVGFEQAARQFQAHHVFIPPQFFLRAGRSRILGRQIGYGLNQIRKAVQILARIIQNPRISASCPACSGGGYIQVKWIG